MFHAYMYIYITRYQCPMIKLHGICIFVDFCHPIPLEHHVVMGMPGMRPKSGANGPILGFSHWSFHCCWLLTNWSLEMLSHCPSEHIWSKVMIRFHESSQFMDNMIRTNKTPTMIYQCVISPYLWCSKRPKNNCDRNKSQYFTSNHQPTSGFQKYISHPNTDSSCAQNLLSYLQTLDYWSPINQMNTSTNHSTINQPSFTLR